MIDVIDVESQHGFDMSMQTFSKYYTQEKRDRLLNVISLEFTKTKLETLVQSPLLVSVPSRVCLFCKAFRVSACVITSPPLVSMAACVGGRPAQARSGFTVFTARRQHRPDRLVFTLCMDFFRGRGISVRVVC